MSSVVIHGFAGSTYVRTARLACIEKGVDHELRALPFRQPAHYALHPWGRMPVLTHGDLVLFETAAICRYIDEAFDGPALQPAGAADRARMSQWISVYQSYVYPTMVHELYFPITRAQKAGTEPDAEKVAAAVAKVAHDLSLVEQAHGEGAWIIGEHLSLADLFFAPAMELAMHLETTAHLFDRTPELCRALGALQARPSWEMTRPD